MKIVSLADAVSRMAVTESIIGHCQFNAYEADQCRAVLRPIVEALGRYNGPTVPIASIRLVVDLVARQGRKFARSKGLPRAISDFSRTFFPDYGQTELLTEGRPMPRWSPFCEEGIRRGLESLFLGHEPQVLAMLEMLAEWVRQWDDNSEPPATVSK